MIAVFNTLPLLLLKQVSATHPFYTKSPPMSQVIKKGLQEGYNRLKKALKKAFPDKQQNTIPQLILQPYRNRR